jgi:Rha family phage regulatory protein
MITIKPTKDVVACFASAESTSRSVINLTAGLIQTHGRNLWTTSQLIADRFGKRHGNVIRSIENLECSIEFHQLNFESVEYIDDGGKPRKSFNISRDGFSLLGMGFTGKSAAKWKEQFIEAFRSMELELLRIANRKADPSLKIANNEKSAAAVLMTDCLLDVRRELGKTTGPHNFSNEHSLCNWTLTGKFGPINPTELDCHAIRRLTTIRRRNSVLILKGSDYASRKIKLREEYPMAACTLLEVA